MSRIPKSANPNIEVIFTDKDIRVETKYMSNNEKWIFRFDEFNGDVYMIKQHIVTLVISIMSSDFFDLSEKVEALNYIDEIFEEVCRMEV